jgi:hypothetical protein
MAMEYFSQALKNFANVEVVVGGTSASLCAAGTKAGEVLGASPLDVWAKPPGFAVEVR